MVNGVGPPAQAQTVSVTLRSAVAAGLRCPFMEARPAQLPLVQGFDRQLDLRQALELCSTKLLTFCELGDVTEALGTVSRGNLPACYSRLSAQRSS